MQTREREATAARGDVTPDGWRRLALMAAAGICILFLAFMAVAGEVIPPIVLFVLLFATGAYLVRREGKAGPIMLIVLSVLFLLLNLPFIVPALSVPASTLDFLVTAAGVTLTLMTLIAAIGALRSRGADTSAPRVVGAAGAGIVALSVVVAIVAAVTYEDAVARPGDVEITTEHAHFSPDEITVEAGTVGVYLENQEQAYHTFTIEELDVDVDLPGGKTARVEFDAEPGTYTFICRPHEGEGMKGTLTVS